MFGCIRKDLYLLFHKKAFLIALIILTFLISYICLNDINHAYNCGKSYQHFFTIVFDSSKMSFTTALFYVIPLLVVLPFADTWIDEEKMRDIVFTRTKKSQFFISKYVLSFLSGFLVLFIPLMIAYIAEILALDFNDNVLNILAYAIPDHCYNGMLSNYAFYELYAQHPYIYIIMFNFFISMFGGLYAISAFSISLITNNKVLTYIGIFFFSIISLLFVNLLPEPYGYYTIQRMTRPFSNYDFSVAGYFIWIIFFLICNGMMYLLYLRRDPLEKE